MVQRDDIRVDTDTAIVTSVADAGTEAEYAPYEIRVGGCDSSQLGLAAGVQPANRQPATTQPDAVSLVRLRDGAEVLLRDALPEDEANLSEMFFQLGDDTRYYYFFTGVPAIASWAKRFTALGAADGINSYALLAQVEERIVGLARFDRTAGTSVAEIGILLVDSWQSRGLGQRMIARLAGEARERGIATFIGRVLGENRRALALARRALPGVHIAWASGEFELQAGIEPPSDDTATERDT